MPIGRYWFVVVCLVSLACTCRAAPTTGTQLLSITGIKLQPLKNGLEPSGQFVAGFDIKTWGVRVIAVCHIPGGWTVSAGKNANPEGVLSGSGGEGVTFLDADSLPQLANLFLVQVDEYHPTDTGDCAKNCTPATFAGNIYIGRYGVESDLESRRVLPSNIHLDPASRCPDPSR
jgi:hypothetical protein